MATILNSKRKLCIVKTNGPIHELGGITGPILAPCQIAMRAVINMVQNGKKVYEVNPKNRAETVLLTIQNVQKNNFPEPEKFIMPQEKNKQPEPKFINVNDAINASQNNISVNPLEEKVDKIVKDGINSSNNNVEKSDNKVVDHKTFDNNNVKNGKSDFNKK